MPTTMTGREPSSVGAELVFENTNGGFAREREKVGTDSKVRVE